MCDIAPFCMKCVWEDVEDKLIMCKANRMHFYLREIPRSLPGIGDLFEAYQCQGFIPAQVEEE